MDFYSGEAKGRSRRGDILCTWTIHLQLSITIHQMRKPMERERTLDIVFKVPRITSCALRIQLDAIVDRVHIVASPSGGPDIEVSKLMHEREDLKIDKALLFVRNTVKVRPTIDARACRSGRCLGHQEKRRAEQNVL